MKITLVRHGEVEAAFVGRYNGHSDISLSQKGKEQARALGKKLQTMAFDTVYASDLRRVRETLNEFHLQVPTHFSPQLREKSWGIHEGKSFEEIEAMGIKYENFSQWIDALDGESQEHYRAKIADYFYNVIAKDKAPNILVVTHAGVVATFMSIHKGISLEAAFSEKLEYGEFMTINL